MTHTHRPPRTSWTRIGVCPADVLTDRLHHAGLSPDGRWCFLAATHDEAYGVWDIRHNRLVWVEDGQQATPNILTYVIGYRLDILPLIPRRSVHAFVFLASRISIRSS